MLPAFLITFREVIEASLIVATILGILVRLKQKKAIKSVWFATIAAAGVSVFFLVLGSLICVKVQEVYSGMTEGIIEGILMVISAVFITWAVFFLHNYFGRYKTHLLQKIKSSVEKEEQKGLFILTFVAVFREGFEIVLFLSMIYFSSDPRSILSGFALGTTGALLVSFGMFTAALKLPVFYAFRITSALLILFAGGLLARGIHEFVEIGVIPEIGKMTLFALPANATFAGEIFAAVFGITQKMDMIQLAIYGSYVAFMSWRVFLRKTSK